ncbi:hypothetical protein GGR19_003110 [Croceicoccus naphthovorans]|nr:hypothetical protein [Croceicoccus naphthovorans]
MGILGCEGDSDAENDVHAVDRQRSPNLPKNKSQTIRAHGQAIVH